MTNKATDGKSSIRALGAKGNFRQFLNAGFMTGGLIVLSGCNQIGGQMGGIDPGTTGSTFKSSHVSAFEHTLSEKVTVSDAFVELPSAAGKIIEVAQTRYGNGVEQLVIYQGDSATRGENAALVQMAVHVDGKKYAESLKIKSVSVGQITREIKDALPGVNMRISDEVLSNAYGPFGYALGQAPGNVRCIYGWQQMKGQKRGRRSLFQRSSQSPRLSVRLRVCRSKISNAGLVNLMRRLRINADPEKVLRPTAVSWNAGTPGGASRALPQYAPSGYVSRQDEYFEEPASSPVGKAGSGQKKARKSVTRRRATKRAVQPKRVSSTTASARGTNGVYNPPLPGRNSAAHTATTRTQAQPQVMPMPGSVSTVRAPVLTKPAPSSAPSKTARIYNPPKAAVTSALNGSGDRAGRAVSKHAASSGHYSSVPLPD